MVARCWDRHERMTQLNERLIGPMRQCQRLPVRALFVVVDSDIPHTSLDDRQASTVKWESPAEGLDRKSN